MVWMAPNGGLRNSLARGVHKDADVIIRVRIHLNALGNTTHLWPTYVRHVRNRDDSSSSGEGSAGDGPIAFLGSEKKVATAGSISVRVVPWFVKSPAYPVFVDAIVYVICCNERLAG